MSAIPTIMQIPLNEGIKQIGSIIHKILCGRPVVGSVTPNVKAVETTGHPPAAAWGKSRPGDQRGSLVMEDLQCVVSLDPDTEHGHGEQVLGGELVGDFRPVPASADLLEMRAPE